MTISKPNLLRRYGCQWLLSGVSLFLCNATVGAENTSDVPLTGEHNQSQSFNNRASELAMQAMGLLGINYKRGGNEPENGLDCSGFVQYVYREAWGLTLPRTSVEISKVGKNIKIKDLQPGDLVFFNTLRRGFSHVGIYLGENKFIHSPSTGGQVRIENLDVRYWKKRYNGARRITDPEQKVAAPMVASTATSAAELIGSAP